MPFQPAAQLRAGAADGEQLTAAGRGGYELLQAPVDLQDAVLGAMSSTSDPNLGIWEFFDFLEQNAFPGLTATEQGYCTGT